MSVDRIAVANMLVAAAGVSVNETIGGTSRSSAAATWLTSAQICDRLDELIAEQQATNAKLDTLIAGQETTNTLLAGLGGL